MAKRNLIVLVLANALLGAQMPMMFTIAGLAGQSLAVNVCFATLPITMIVLASMLSAYPLSMLIHSQGLSPPKKLSLMAFEFSGDCLFEYLDGPGRG